MEDGSASSKPPTAAAAATAAAATTTGTTAAAAARGAAAAAEEFMSRLADSCGLPISWLHALRGAFCVAAEAFCPSDTQRRAVSLLQQVLNPKP